MYLPRGGPVPFLLFLLSALYKIRNPGRQSEVIRIISCLLLLLLDGGLGPGLRVRAGGPEAALAAVEAAVTRRQLGRTVTRTRPETGHWSDVTLCTLRTPRNVETQL